MSEEKKNRIVKDYLFHLAFKMILIYNLLVP